MVISFAELVNMPSGMKCRHDESRWMDGRIDGWLVTHKLIICVITAIFIKRDIGYYHGQKFHIVSSIAYNLCVLSMVRTGFYSSYLTKWTGCAAHTWYREKWHANQKVTFHTNFTFLFPTSYKACYFRSVLLSFWHTTDCYASDKHKHIPKWLDTIKNRF